MSLLRGVLAVWIGAVVLGVALNSYFLLYHKPPPTHTAPLSYREHNHTVHNHTAHTHVTRKAHVRKPPVIKPALVVIPPLSRCAQLFNGEEISVAPTAVSMLRGRVGKRRTASDAAHGDEAGSVGKLVHADHEDHPADEPGAEDAGHDEEEAEEDEEQEEEGNGHHDGAVGQHMSRPRIRRLPNGRLLRQKPLDGGDSASSTQSDRLVHHTNAELKHVDIHAPEGKQLPEGHKHYLAIAIPSAPRTNHTDYLTDTLKWLLEQLPEPGSKNDTGQKGKILVVVQNNHPGYKWHNYTKNVKVPVTHNTTRWEPKKFNEYNPRHPVFHRAKETYASSKKARKFLLFRDNHGLKYPDPDPPRGQPPEPNLKAIPGQIARKQTLDVIHMLEFVERSCEYFMFMEDDFKLCPGGLDEILYVLNKADKYLNWNGIRVSFGLNGILMKCKDLPMLRSYLMVGVMRLPVDLLVSQWFLAQRDELLMEQMIGRRNMVYRFNVLEHRGNVSTFPGRRHGLPFPLCHKQLDKVWSLNRMELFKPKECPKDDLWPCPKGGHASFRHNSLQSVKINYKNKTLSTRPVMYQGATLEDSVMMYGKPGETCNKACENIGLKCVFNDFSLVNTCKAMRRMFKCKTCRESIGSDQPAFDPTSDVCLYNKRVRDPAHGSRCEGQFFKTMRLCACNKNLPPADQLPDQPVDEEMKKQQQQHEEGRDPGQRYDGAKIKTHVPVKLNGTTTYAGLHMVAANVGEDCDVACGAVSMNCINSAFRDINNCGKLQRAFDCKACRESMGSDQPAFDTRTIEGGESCLFNKNVDNPSTGSRCGGKHPLTQRLCPCAA